MTIQDEITIQDDKQLHNNGQYEKDSYNKSKAWPQVLAVIAVSLGPLTGGILMTWSSPFALAITKDKENYDITEDEASYFIVFQPVGMIFASLFFFKIAEILGRKKSLLFLAIPHLSCWIIIMLARTKWHFYGARFVGGIGDAVLYCSVPPYVGEITTPKLRGFLGNLPMFFVNAGSFSITVLGSYLGVRTTAYICIVFPISYILLVSMLPESPYQLIRDSKYDKARISIKWLSRKSNIEEDFINMKADVERQMSERVELEDSIKGLIGKPNDKENVVNMKPHVEGQTSGGAKWSDLFKIDSNRRALRAGVFLRLSQQLCGITVFSTYTQTIFEKAGGKFSPQASSMIFIGIAWMLNLCSGVTVEKVGRRLSYFFSLLSCGTILVIMSVYFMLEQYKLANLETLNWFPLVGMILYIITYSFGLGIVPTLMLGELFSANIKSKALSVLMMVFGLMVFFTTNLFRQLNANIGLYSPFLVYGICCIFSSILTLRWVPETKGKTLEEIQQMFKK